MRALRRAAGRCGEARQTTSKLDGFASGYCNACVRRVVCCALAHSTPLRCPCRSGCSDRFVLLLLCLSVVRCAAVSTQVAFGCRGRLLRCIVSHMRAVFSSKTSSFVSNRSRMSSLRAAVAPSHRARDARAHAAHRRACTLRGACCLLPALWRWCKLRGACGCIAQR